MHPPISVADSDTRLFAVLLVPAEPPTPAVIAHCPPTQGNAPVKHTWILKPKLGR